MFYLQNSDDNEIWASYDDYALLLSDVRSIWHQPGAPSTYRVLRGEKVVISEI